MALPSPAIDLAEEIRSLIQGDDLSRAAKRLLDYTKQFSGQRELINSAIVLTGELRSLQRDIRKFGDTSDRRSQLNVLAHRILGFVDEVEAPPDGPPLAEPPEPPRLRVVTQVPKLEEDKPGGREEINTEQGLTKLEQARKRFVEDRKKPPSTAVLEASGLRKTYRGGFALSGIDLTLRPGEITGVVGVNASGKTTLLRILAGELAADGGTLAYPLLCPEGPNWVRIRSQIA